MCRVFSCVVGREYDQGFSWQNSISLCPASFHIPRPKLPVTPGVSWLPTFSFQLPIMKRTSILGVLEGLVGLHRTVQLQLLQHYWSGHRLGLPWYWMVYLGNKQRSFCRFWDCIQVLHFRLCCWPWWLLHFFWGIAALSSRCNGHLSQIHPFQSILVHSFLECWCSLLPPPVWPLPICLDSWTWHSRFLCNIALYSIRPCFYNQSHPQLGIVFALAPSLHSFWSYFSTDLQ